MSSVWTIFREAGFIGLLIVPIALLALLLAAAAAIGGLVAKNPRPFTFVGAIALALAGLGMLTGGLGVWYGRNRANEALAYAQLDDFEQIERICTVGYHEARSSALIALGLVALPLLLALIAPTVAWSRSRDASGRRPAVDIAIVGAVAFFALGGVVLAAVGARDATDEARARALEQLRTTTTGVLNETHCDPCPLLAEAIRARGAATIDEDVPGATDRARQCIDDWLDRIEKGERADRKCTARDARADVRAAPAAAPVPKSEEPDDASLTDRERALRDAARFGITGLLNDGAPEKRRAELEAVLASPLLLDDAQRERAQNMLREVNTPDAPGGTVPRGASSMRMNAATVVGSMSSTVVRRVLRHHRNRFRFCYEKRLRHDPTLRGRVEVRFIIQKDGRVGSVTTSGDLDDAKLEACLVTAFRMIQFPRPRGGIVSVVYPLQFSPDP
ncbi:MAG: AgmX/PglI C-terminal domain-containing protein [Myxococcota bacterium]